MYFLLSLLLLAPPAVLGLTEAEMASTLRGKVVTRTESFKNAHGQPAGRGQGAIVINRPIAEVWKTLAHLEDRAEYVPRLESVTVLERQPGRAHVRQQVNASVTTARYTLWYTFDEATHTIGWKLDQSAPGNTIAGADGDYRMAALTPGRTLLVYRAYVDAGHWVPHFIQTYMQKRSIPGLLRAIKHRVESGGTWKKP